jgi:hypothetical protein
VGKSGAAAAKLRQDRFPGLAPMIRDFYVFIPSWLWHGRPTNGANTANYFTWKC